MKYLLISLILTLLIGFTPMLIQAQEPININTADAKTLTELKRIGTKYAERIIKYRETNGPFEKPEDIQNVPGIGPKTYEANKDRIVITVPKSEDNNGPVEDKDKKTPE